MGDGELGTVVWGGLILGVAMFGSTSARAQQNQRPLDVEVVNPPEQPVPVTGTVDVEGSVEVNNAASAPVVTRDVDDSGLTDVYRGNATFTGTFDLACSPPLTTSPQIDTIPAGKRLVLEYVSASVYSANPCGGEAISVRGATIAGTFPLISIPVTNYAPEPVSGYVGFTGGQAVKAYVNAGEIFHVCAHRLCSGGDFTVFAQATGRLLDVPSP